MLGGKGLDGAVFWNLFVFFLGDTRNIASWTRVGGYGQMRVDFFFSCLMSPLPVWLCGTTLRR